MSLALLLARHSNSAAAFLLFLFSSSLQVLSSAHAAIGGKGAGAFPEYKCRRSVANAIFLHENSHSRAKPFHCICQFLRRLISAHLVERYTSREYGIVLEAPVMNRYINIRAGSIRRRVVAAINGFITNTSKIGNLIAIYTLIRDMTHYVVQLGFLYTYSSAFLERFAPAHHA